MKPQVEAYKLTRLSGIYIPIGIGRCTDNVSEITITFGAP